MVEIFQFHGVPPKSVIYFEIALVRAIWVQLYWFCIFFEIISKFSVLDSRWVDFIKFNSMIWMGSEVSIETIWAIIVIEMTSWILKFLLCKLTRWRRVTWSQPPLFLLREDQPQVTRLERVSLHCFSDIFSWITQPIAHNFGRILNLTSTIWSTAILMLRLASGRPQKIFVSTW